MALPMTIGNPAMPEMEVSEALRDKDQIPQSIDKSMRSARDASLGIMPEMENIEVSEVLKDKEPIPQSIDKSMRAARDMSYSHIWRRFLPAILAYPMWFYVMTKNDAWSDAFGTYYPLTIAMVFGSLIAGSTPLGGGVVAFPVSVLFIKFKPAQGRDFALIIQSVGMTAASFLIIYARRQLCHVWLILWFTFSAMFGMIIGFETEMSDFIINVVFTTAVACFAMAFAYRNYVGWRVALQKKKDAPKCDQPPDDAWALLEPGRFQLAETTVYKFLGSYYPFALTACACVFGVVGGFLTSKLGSGADMLAYMFGVFVWNTTCPHGADLPDNMLTASSVIIMAACSIFGVFLRSSTSEISTEVYLCWGACVPIVLLGAPTGSLLLTPAMTNTLRKIFYLLSIVQLVSFGIFKIKGTVAAWIGISSAIFIMGLTIYCHYVSLVLKEKRAKVPYDEGGAQDFM